MGLAMEVVSGFVANTTGTPTVDTVTNAAGDTTAVRNYNPGAAAYVLDQWALADTVGIVQQIKSPRMHDNVNGVQVLPAANTSRSLYSAYARELVYAQDVLGVGMLDLGGGGSGPDSESYLVHYTDLPGSSARLYRWADIVGRIEHQMAVQVTLTSAGATAGDYDAAVAINAVQDQFKANRDYAILGYTTSVELGTIGIRSADFANLRIGGPGPAGFPDETRDWFVRISEDNGLPCIPVFNAANKNTTVVDCTDPQGNLPGDVFILCALLRSV